MEQLSALATQIAFPSPNGSEIGSHDCLMLTNPHAQLFQVDLTQASVPPTAGVLFYSNGEWKPLVAPVQQETGRPVREVSAQELTQRDSFSL